jgi:phenazine biosynthesis protein phzE
MAPYLRPDPPAAGLRATVVDAEDSFTAMLAFQLRALGLTVTVTRFDAPLDLDAADLVVLGSGPGDPRRAGDPRMRRLAGLAELLLADCKPLLALCLGHQVVALRLGLRVRRLAAARQGVQRRIEVFGDEVRVGFYNAFAAFDDTDQHATDLAADAIGMATDHILAMAAVGLRPASGPAAAPAPSPAAKSATPLTISSDPASGEIFAMRRPGLWTCQFHPESVLSPDGLRILDHALAFVHSGHQPTFHGGSSSA